MPQKRSRFILAWLVFGYAFLYTPILTLILFSFNNSRTITSWSGFSLRWYKSLFTNEKILHAGLVSLKIAFMSATIAVLIGTIGALVMVRFKAFKGRTFFNSIITAPLVMPDVMTGLALLLMFVMMDQILGWPSERGVTTISIGHITISIAYVLVIVRARLSEFDYYLEEAALDLGARPLRVFLWITLPLISPSLATGWLLAFTLSLDDVVLASILSGPGGTTLPMVVFSSIRFGVTPEINALATIILLLVSIAVTLAGITMYKKSQSSD